MKNINFKTAIVFLLLPVLMMGQTTFNTESKVTAATVYKSGALVTREASVDLNKGVQVICFSNLTTDITDESVAVSAGKNEKIRILDVTVNRKMTTETQQEKTKILQKRIDSLRAIKAEIDVELTVLNTTKEFIESVKPQQSQPTQPQKTAAAPIADYTAYIKQWSEALSYFDENLAKTQQAILEKTSKAAQLQEGIQTLREEIERSSGVTSRDYKEIIVTVESLKKQKATLAASYIVPNAKWFPVYDARVNAVDKINELSYFGMLQQATGEDWEDIALTLSTSEPQTSKSLPQLDNWFVDLKPIPQRSSDKYGNPGGYVTYEQNWGLPKGKGAITGYVKDNKTDELLAGAEVIVEGTKLSTSVGANGKFYIANIPAGMRQVKITEIGYTTERLNIEVREKNTAFMNANLMAMSLQTPDIEINVSEMSMPAKAVANDMVVMEDAIQGGVVVPKEREKYTEIYSNDMATNFVIPSKYSIPSNMDPHKVTIAIEEMKIDFERSALPKITPKVFLKGTVLNKNKYPWLGGEINVFVDGEFLSKTSMKTIVPGDSLAFTLGPDELIRTERVLVKRNRERPGLFQSKIKETVEYEFHVSNNRKTEETLLITDQLPISSNEEVVVEPIEPVVVLKDLNNEHKMEWRITLKPGERKIIPFKFRVFYPKEMFGMVNL